MKPETPRGDVLEEGDDRRLEPDGAGCLRSPFFSGVGSLSYFRHSVSLETPGVLS